VTFPATPLDQTVELFIDGAWTDVTSLVYGRDPVTITRGRADEATEVDPSTCRATINNRSGDFSPRNPTGQYYGLIGRNTPMRVRISPANEKYLLLTGAHDSNALATSPDTECSTPDSANLSITGDIDIRVDVRPDSWTRYGQGIASKYTQVSDQRSWAFWINTDGTLTFTWSTAGTAATLLTATSTAAVTIPADGRLTLRVTLDVNNGAGGKTAAFYTGTGGVGGSFTQLGSDVTTAGTTSIFDSTAQVEIGRSHTTTSGGDIRGRVYGFQLRQNIAGTVRAHVVVDDDAEAGDASFTGTDTLTWTLGGDASIVDPAIRFSGEVSDWPQRWDTTGTDVHVPILASGVLRRLSQGSTPLKSTLYRGYTTLADQPKAYWPCEDGTDATEIASALAGHPPMFITPVTDSPSMASFTDFKCSAPLPTFNGSQWVGPVPSYTSTGDIQVWFLMAVPAGGSVDAQGVMTVRTIGTAPEWRVLYESDGSLTVQAYAADGTQLLTNTAAFDVNGRLLRVDLELSQNGSDVDWDLATLEVGESSGSVNSGTLASRTITKATSVTMNAGGDHTEIAVGHISVHDSIRSLFDLAEELNAYSGESAARRIQRLCGEEELSFRGIGDLDGCTPLGPQTPEQLVTLLREAAAADDGILYESRDLLGIEYRTGDSMYHQDAVLTLDYSAADLSAIEPVDDDQRTRNDVTANRTDGSSARVTKETGPLSVQAPPDGVGRYDEAVTLNVESDGQLADKAGWRVHLGTVDEARYPQITLDLARANFIDANADQGLAVQDLNIGERLVIANPPNWFPPDDISLLVQGCTETLANFTHAIQVNTSPETPWGQAGFYDDTDARYTSDGTVLAEDLTTGETGVDVTTASGPVWSDADGDFDIIVGGERMTVTAISGTTANQTFTVTRSVNGVTKTHSTGATVELAAPTVYVP
jgi:hypothetical protein